MSSEQFAGPESPPLPPVLQNQQSPQSAMPQVNTPLQSTPEVLHRLLTLTPIPGSHPANPEPSRKRARPTVSCLECRRKKLKCDRALPCSQCVKARREDLCQFANGVLKAGVSQARPQALAAARDDDGEMVGKRMRIEDVMSPSSTAGNGLVGDTPGRNVASSGSSLGRIYVKGNRSRYLGIEDRMAMLDHFEDAKSYIMNSFKDPDTAGMMNELSRYQNALQCKPEKSQIQLPHDRTSLLAEMLKSLPTDQSLGVLGSAFSLYATHWEGLTRVLHMPTFIQEMDSVQVVVDSLAAGDDYSLPQYIREPILPQIIGVYVLSARLLKPVKTSITDNQITLWIEMIQRWLDTLTAKERLNIETLRVQILLLLSHMNDLVPNSDLWKESGTLVRSAMIMGLHQDPEKYEAFSLLEKEQRRKLWRTIVELDIQFSLAGGLPAAIRSSDFSSRQLRNVDDRSLKEDMTTYPDDAAERVWTDALPQFVLGASIKDRLDATNTLAGNFNLPRDTGRLLSLAWCFESSLRGLSSNLPGTDSFREHNEERSPGRLFMKLMLDIQLRRPTLRTFEYIMLSENGRQYPEARKGAVRNAIAILSHLDALDPELADPNIIRNRDQLNLFHVLCKKDIIQAALILCLEIQWFSASSRVDRGHSSGVQNLGDDMLPWTKTSLTRIVENTLNSLLHQLGDCGSDLKDILPLSIVLQSARSDGSPDDKKVLMRKGAERVLKACREALSHVLTTPASLNKGQAPNSGALREPYNWAKYHSGTPLEADLRNGHGERNMLPGNEVTFQGFDFDFGDWDVNGSWF